jgi:hypothetical protein
MAVTGRDRSTYPGGRSGNDGRGGFVAILVAVEWHSTLVHCPGTLNRGKH